jgi:hypothetical protein
MFASVRDAPPRMLGYSFSQDFDSRHGFALSRGTSFFVIKMREGGALFTVNGVQRPGLLPSEAAQLLWDHVLCAFPHLDVRTTCLYKTRKAADAADALRERLLELLRLERDERTAA